MNLTITFKCNDLSSATALADALRLFSIYGYHEHRARKLAQEILGVPITEVNIK